MGKIIYLHVRPSSKEEKIEKISIDEYIICVKEQAVKGKANKAVIKLLSKEFGISYKNIRIKNPLSKKKIVEITLQNN